MQQHYRSLSVQSREDVQDNPQDRSQLVLEHQVRFRPLGRNSRHLYIRSDDSVLALLDECPNLEGLDLEVSLSLSDYGIKFIGKQPRKLVYAYQSHRPHN